MEVKQKSIKDIEKVSDKYILKRIKFLTENDLQVSIGVNRLYEDFDISSIATDFERDILVDKVNKRLDILTEEFLNKNQSNEYSLSKEGQKFIKPFYKKIPWWALVIALISGITPIVFNFISKCIKNN